jgi:hypothetical protein
MYGMQVHQHAYAMEIEHRKPSATHLQPSLIQLPPKISVMKNDDLSPEKAVLVQD